MISYLVFYALEHYIYNLFFVAHSTLLLFFFFFNDTATTEIYTLSLHDALPILIPALLLWFPMPMVIGGVVGLLILTLVLACPYAGLIIFLGLLYLRPEEIFPKLAGARMTLVVSLVTLFAWAVNALLRRERSLLHLPVVRCFIGFVVLAIGSTAYNVPDLGTLSGVALDVIKLLILFVLVVHLVNTLVRLRAAIGALL